MQSHTSWRIGIDCRLAGKQHAGIGRYIENLILRLPQISQQSKQQVEWVFFFYNQAQAEEFSLPENVKIVLVPYRHYSLAEQLFAHRYFSGEKLDLLHVPHFNIPLLYRGKILVTIHDLLWHEYKGAQVTTLPPWQYFLKYQAYLFTVSQAVRRASHILVPAETVKQTVLRYYPFAVSKVTVTKEGLARPYEQVIASTVGSTKNELLPKSKRLLQLVYVGSLYPHKNLKVVIGTLKQLSGFKLIVAGTRSVFQTQTQQQVDLSGVSDRVEFRGYLTDDELICLYQASFALVQPSLSEGFGLTGVEAMAAGIPVLASRIPIFQEIYQGAAQYFDPLSQASFYQAVGELRAADWAKVILKGQQVASQYVWQKTAVATWQCYTQVLR